ncbi:hypothetical protein FQA39_LY03327 [Lamprigera yunnana]|nr:hypothetical protein FQA39_LY03327 [Lamprigera yunnana]
MAREVLTLQFGHYSNFVGTHWWNIQETGFEYCSDEPSEINHDVLFREGLTNQGVVTFTPRLLLVDLKGALRTLPEVGTLYDPIPSVEDVNVNWSERVEVETAEAELLNEFQQCLSSDNNTDTLQKTYPFDKTVKVWSDFLYSRFHPRTVNVVQQYSYESAYNFNSFSQGTALWQIPQFNETFSDKIRNYIEECDNLQGFHIILDATNGFSGLAASCMRHIEEEYEKKPILAFPVIPSHYQENEHRTSCLTASFREMNIALCFDSLNEHSSLFVPISTGTSGWRCPTPKRTFNHVSFNQNLHYHTSAILAAALDTITIKHRLRSSQYCLKDLSADFNIYGRKMAAASMCLPFPIHEGCDFIDCLDNWEGPLTRNITPNCSLGTDKLVQLFTIRGIPEDRLKRPLSESHLQYTMPAYQCNSISEMLSFYLSCNYFFCLSNVVSTQKGISVKTPFPSIFGKPLNCDGNISEGERYCPIDQVPILAGIQSGSTIGRTIESLYLEVKKVKQPEVNAFASGNIELHDIIEGFERLLDMKECYEDGYS